MNKYILIILSGYLYATSFSMDVAKANRLQQKYPAPIDWKQFEAENLDEYSQDEVAPLLCAAVSQKAPVKVVRKIIDDKELSSNTRDENGNPVLTLAILNQNTEAASVLLNRKAKVVYEMDKPQYSGSNGDYPHAITPWQAACVVGEEKYVTALHAKMTRQDQRSIIRQPMVRLGKKSPMDYALVHKKAQLAKFLCSVDEYLISADYDSQRATNAAEWHDATYLKMLFKNIGQIIGTDKNRLLYSAVNAGNLEGVFFLIAQGAQVEPEACANAALRENKTMLDALCATGVDLNAQDSLPLRQCLMSALKTTTPVTLLLKAGAKPEQQQKERKTQPIHCIASSHLDLPMKKALVTIFRNRGISLNTPDNNGQTLLHRACDGQIHATDDQFMFHLLELGANPDICDGDGKTSFLLFCKTNRNPEKLRKFLETFTPAINVQDNTGNTPLIYAASQGKKSSALIALLITYGANIATSCNEMLHMACRTLNVELAQSLIETYSASTKHVNSHTRTALMEVIKAHNFAGKGWNASNSEKIARAKLALTNLLVQKGAELNAQDKDGKTALYHAVATERLSEPIIKKLLDLGADASIRDTQKKTPLEISISGVSVYSQSKNITALLLAHTKENPIVFSTGQTPIEYLMASKRSSSFDNDWSMDLLNLFTTQSSQKSN